MYQRKRLRRLGYDNYSNRSHQRPFVRRAIAAKVASLTPSEKYVFMMPCGSSTIYLPEDPVAVLEFLDIADDAEGVAVILGARLFLDLRTQKTNLLERPASVVWWRSYTPPSHTEDQYITLSEWLIQHGHPHPPRMGLRIPKSLKDMLKTVAQGAYGEMDYLVHCPSGTSAILRPKDGAIYSGPRIKCFYVLIRDGPSVVFHVFRKEIKGRSNCLVYRFKEDDLDGFAQVMAIAKT